jgi:hypothetical protein
MGYVNKIKYLTSILFIVFGITFSQQNDIVVKLRDYHTAEVTDVLASKAYPYFFTADASGKVLLHSKETKRVVHTVKPASGFPITDMRLSNDDLMLTVNQKIQFSDGKSDSIISIEVFTGKRLFQEQGNINFIGNQDDGIIIQDTNPQGRLHIIDVYNDKFEKVRRYYYSRKITLGAYDFVSNQLAVVEGNVGNQLSVSIQTGGDYENLKKIEIPKRSKVLDLFFHDDKLYAITHKHTGKSKIISIHNLTKNATFSKPVFKEESRFSSYVHINRVETSKGFQIAITAKSSLTLRPFIIEKSNSKYKSWVPETKNAVNNYLYLPEQKEHLLFENYNSNFGSAMRYLVYDAASKSVSYAIPEKGKKFYYGSYLPNNDWIVIGNDKKGFEFQLKYYENGTFNNRFNKLDYSSYMLVYHGVKDFERGEFRFNKYNGIHPFYGSIEDNKGIEKRGFFAYDLIKDEVITISTIDIVKTTIIDYNHNSKRLLLSHNRYYNGGYAEPSSYVLLDNDKITTIDGVYKFGNFSGDGNYLILISDKNLLTIRSVDDQNIIHTETLTDGKYKIFIEEDSAFFVTNSYWTIDIEKCNQVTIGYDIKDNDEIERNEASCAHIIDAASYGEKSYVSAEFIGLIIGDKVMKFPPTDFPQHISTNKDGKNLMVSFNSGRIKIYDIATRMPIAQMLHPDKNNHVFIDSEGNFFSNVNPKDYMYATKNGKSIALTEIESTNFKPEKILEHFGEPNQDYLTTLERALVLKSNSVLQAESTKDIAKSKPSTSNKKGDLYVMAIGVSEYEQSNYNLTFADKDALDMARIYGSINKEDLEYYNTNFLGERFHLIDEKHGFTKELRKYSELFTSIGQLSPLSPDGRFWLEVKYGDYFIWDFNSKSIEPIKLPRGVEIRNYRFDKHLFIDPDGLGFYVMSDNDKFYFYSFFKKSFKSIKLTDQKDGYYLDSNRLSFIANNQWAYFESKERLDFSAVSITKGSKTSSEESSISFRTDQFNITSAEGKVSIDSFNFRATFKALSSNGNHLIYSDFNGQLFYKNLAKPQVLPQKLLVPEVDVSDQISIANDGLSFAVLLPLSNEDRQQIVFYDMLGRQIKTKSIDQSIVGFSVFNAHYSAIERMEPITKQFGALINEELDAAEPHSFNQTKVKYLINENASSSAIKEELSDFFRAVKPEDQIMIFLAGHGVLDKNLEYYFAPHDMNFGNVTENGISLELILKSLTDTQSKHQLLLMDSCHSGNTLDIDSKTIVVNESENSSNQRGSKSKSVNSRNNFRVSEVVSGLFEDFLSQSGVTIISASSGADVAYENAKMGNGAFTSAYISLLKDKLLAGYSTVKDEFKSPVSLDEEGIEYLLTKVMQLTNAKQLPDLREFNTSSHIKMW